MAGKPGMQKPYTLGGVDPKQKRLEALTDERDRRIEMEIDRLLRLGRDEARRRVLAAQSEAGSFSDKQRNLTVAAGVELVLAGEL